MQTKKENLTEIAKFAGVSFKTLYNYKNTTSNKHNIYKALKLAYFLKDLDVNKVKEDLEELEAILKICCKNKEDLKTAAQNNINNISSFLQTINNLLSVFKD